MAKKATRKVKPKAALTDGGRAGKVDYITVRREKIPTKTQEMPHRDLKYFPDNPRVYSILRSARSDPTQREIEEQMQGLEHVKELMIDIRRNGGLIEPLVVKDKSLEVIEGNSRLAALRLLSEKNPAKWSDVKCVVLPYDTDERLISALLGEWHLKGKTEWPPYEQAGYLYRRHKEYGIDIDGLSKEVGLKKAQVQQYVVAYEFMVKHKDDRRDRWSYYLEYTKSRKIGAARRKFEKLDRIVVKQIKGGKICRAQDLRQYLPVVCQDEKTLRKYVRGDYLLDEAHSRAVKAGGDHTPYKRLKRFRTWLAEPEIQTELAGSNGQIRTKVKFELNKLHSLVDRLNRKLKK